MPRVQYYAAASLDGYIAAEGDDLQWLFDAADNPLEGGDDNYNAFYAQVTALAIGASTYRFMLGHEWAYEGVPAWVFTHREFATPEGADVRFVQGSVADHIADMKAAAGDGDESVRDDWTFEDPPITAWWTLPDDLGRRYAGVSGDHNPIHLHAWSAKPFGFPREIAHGMWTKARCLASLRLPDAFEADVKFKKPILLPSTVTFGEAGDRFALHTHLEGRLL